MFKKFKKPLGILLSAALVAGGAVMTPIADFIGTNITVSASETKALAVDAVFAVGDHFSNGAGKYFKDVQGEHEIARNISQDATDSKYSGVHWFKKDGEYTGEYRIDLVYYTTGGSNGLSLCGEYPTGKKPDASSYGIKVASGTGTERDPFVLKVIPYYTVTWMNGDSTLETDTGIEEGAAPSYDGETPTKAGDDDYTYTFSGWTDGTNTYGLDDELPEVTANVTYTAVFEAAANTVSSEVIFDFEDGTSSGFGLLYKNYNYYLPDASVQVVTPDTGKVHSGNYALALNIDYSNNQESGYQMIALYQGLVSGNVDYYPGAKTLGAWIYIPDECVGLWARWMITPIASDDGEGNYTLGSLNSSLMDNTAGGVGVVSTFDESGWHYLKADLSDYKGVAWRDYYYCIQFYISDRDNASYCYYAKDQHNINGAFTLYLDDITVDYSTKTVDRDAPVFSNVLLKDHGTHLEDALVLTNGYVSDGYDQLSFSANVADYAALNASGIDPESAEAYIDGNEVECTYDNGTISIDDEFTFYEGQHKVKFVICDNAGNRASATRTFTVSDVSESELIRIVPHDPALDRILHGSLYWIDVVTTDAANTEYVCVTLNLDSMSKWEIDHMEVADGYSVSYGVIDEGDKTVMLQIAADSEVSQTGELVLVSIPIRAWEMDNMYKKNPLSDKKWNYAEFRSSYEFWPVATEVRIEQGFAYRGDDSVFFTGKDVFVWSESWANYSNMMSQDSLYFASWNGGHDHRSEYADYYAEGTTNHTDPDDIVYVEGYEPVTATCTAAGFTGRTFCTVCNSVVDWGEVIPAKGHSYAVDPEDGLMKCTECGHLKTPVKGHSLTLDGSIGVNFYFELTQEAAESTTVTFSWNGKSLSDVALVLDPNSGLYKATCPIAAAEMTCPITASVTNNGITDSDIDVYSVRDYAMEVINGDNPRRLVDLVKEMLNYGAKAQIVFNVLTDDLANKDVENYTMQPVTQKMISAAVKKANPGKTASIPSKNNSDFGLKYYGTTLVFLSKTTLRHYYKVSSAADFEEALETAEGFTVNTDKAPYVILEKTDIPAAELDEYQEFTIDGQTYNYSVFDYLTGMIKSGSDDYKELAAATYWYNQAANTYFDCDHTEDTSTVKTENELAPTCIADGSYDTVEYCDGCGREISRVTTIVDSDPDAHSLKDVQKAATYFEEGCILHNECEHCGKYFDAETGDEITDTSSVVIPRLTTLDLSTITDDITTAELRDGTTVTGTLSKSCNITVAAGAAVTLQNVNITCLTSDDVFAGITVAGNAEFTLVGTNLVWSGSEDYPAIAVPDGSTLTLQGEGTLKAVSAGDYAAISGGTLAPADGITVFSGSSEDPTTAISGPYTDRAKYMTAEKSRTYNIAYYSNGGTSGPSSFGNSFTYGFAQTILSNTSFAGSSMTKTGHTFNGWNTKADGTGTPYAVGSIYNDAADLKLYAQWTVNSDAV